jgi:ATP-dependent RNA helicase DDX5/DBP2
MTELVDSFVGEEVEDVDFKRLNHKCSEICTSRDVSEINAFIQDPSRNIRLLGARCPNPIFTFDEALLPPEMMSVIAANGWTEPTPIQAVTLPIALCGGDMIGIAKTGSGKTGAFAIPAVLHVLQNQWPGSVGPYAAVICPTCELSQQIYRVLSQFAQVFNLRTACIHGGEGTRGDQGLLCHSHPHIVIAAPGRLLDLARAKDVSMRSVSFLVIDKADNLLQMGFLNQLRAIIRSCQRGRQTLMWSATWPHEVRKLADEFLRTERMFVVAGASERTVNQNIEQTIVQVDDRSRFDSLIQTLERLHKETGGGMKLIIFANSKRRVRELSDGLFGWKRMAVYEFEGDMSQAARDQSMNTFRKAPGNCCLVAPAIGQRGVNVDDVSHVIVYEMPDDIDDYVHRIGRTARANISGRSIGFFSRRSDKPISKELVKVLEQGKQQVPDWLREPAGQIDDETYEADRMRKQKYSPH